jgi:uncharacterized protein YqfA (UPF0365 family)
MDIMMIFIAVAAIVGLIVFSYFIPIRLWFTAIISNVRVSLLQLVLMRFRHH